MTLGHTAQIIAAIVLGSAFGVALHRFGATNSNNLIKMVAFKDFKIMKVIFTAIALTAVGFYVVDAISPGLVNFKPKSADVVGLIVGGLIFGVGFTVGGYCPGTSIGAMGEGRKDALFYVLGGLLGAGFFMLAYEVFFKPVFLKSEWTMDKVNGMAPRLQDLFGMQSGLWIAIGLAIMFMVIVYFLPKGKKEA